MPGRIVAVVATLDTKEPEARYLADALAARGFEARLVDVGIPPVRRAARRDEALCAAAEAAAMILAGWQRDGQLAGAVALGGNQGTAAGAIALRDLPLGVPKILVTTVASGDLRPYLGASDIVVVPAVGDLLGGPNALTRSVLARAGAMLAAAIETGSGAPSIGDRAVALTALGNTQQAADGVIAQLRGRGYETIPFHASGAGGSAMEALVDGGAFAAVVDLTSHELLGEVCGDDIYTPVRPRLLAAGRRGLPQVVAPGGLDYFVFGPPDTVPAKYQGRPTHYHNPYNTNVRATPDELRRTGEELARRLNAARGPVVFLDPLRGWSEIGREGGPLWDAEGNAALRDAVCAELETGKVRYIEVDAAINDPVFVDEVVGALFELLGAPGPAAR